MTQRSNKRYKSKMQLSLPITGYFDFYKCLLLTNTKNHGHPSLNYLMVLPPITLFFKAIYDPYIQL